MPAVAPVDPIRLACLLGPDTWWTRCEAVAQTGSTNDDVLARAEAGEPAGLALFAAHQTRGHGRLDRSWTDVPGAGLAVSVLLRPGRPRSEWGWVPLLTGLAVAEALRKLGPARVGLKWPNDVLLDGAKVCGILAQAGTAAVVVGAGINVALARDELPVPGATSLRLAGLEVDLTHLAAGVLANLQRVLERWEAGADVRADYRAACDTLGRRVRVRLRGDAVVEGTATDVDADGGLVLRRDDGTERAFSAGDVVHLRRDGTDAHR